VDLCQRRIPKFEIENVDGPDQGAADDCSITWDVRFEIVEAML